MKTSPLFFCCVAIATSVDAFTTPKLQGRTCTSLREGPLDVLGGLGATLQKEVGSFFKSKETGGASAAVEQEKPKIPDVVIDPDYRLGIIWLTGGILLDLIPYIQLTLGPIITVLGILFLVQTARLRFCFDENAFELRLSGKDEGGGLQKTGENIVVGDENRWAYDSFVNYDFFPEGWINQPQGPILVYFKETQTPKQKWDEGPGKSANSPEAIANGAKPGQVHFFPAICNCKQLQAEFERRGCAKL